MPIPLFSVLLPVRDGGPLLREAVDSILHQPLPDLELLVVDDGSRDGCLDTLPRDRRLRRLRNSGRGIVSALNTAAGQARGQYLARMDADDIALPRRLACQAELLDTEPELGIVGARVDIFTDQGAPAGGYRRYQDWINELTTPEAIRREIFIESPIPHPTAVLRRRVFQRLGGYRDSPWAEDYDLWLRAWAAGIPMAKPEPVLLRWRDHGRRLSRVDRRYDLSRFIQAKAWMLSRTLLADRPAVIWGATPTGALLCDGLRAHGVTVEAFLDIDPRKIGGRKRGRPVLHYSHAPRFAGALMLGAVSLAGARLPIREALGEMGFSEGRDFVFAA